MKPHRLRLLLLIFWLILAGLIVWFKIIPNGRATYYLSYPNKFNVWGGKGFIGNLTPADRVKIEPGQMAKITGDPVYFSVFTPRTFSEAKVTVTYQDNLTTSTPIVEAGVLVDNIVWRYKLASLQNKILDDGFDSWSRIKSGDILLIQKNNDFLNLSDFLSKLQNSPQEICPKNNLQTCLALYNTESLNDYFSSDSSLIKKHQFKPIEIPIQGAHQFYFVTENDRNLKFDFDFADLNLDKKADPIIISIYRGNEKVYSMPIVDNYGGDGSGQVRTFFVPFVYATSSPLSGLYKLEIKAGEDIVIKKISNAPSALNIIGKVHPVKASSLPLSFWTDSSFIKLTTNNPASRQSLSFGGNNFSLSEPYQQFEFSASESGVKKVSLNKDDVILETDGIFSLSNEDFFNPDFKKVDEHFMLNKDLDYILAKYQSPVKLANNFKQASVILNTKEAYRENGKYSFMISVPGLSLANQGELLIKDIKIEFSGRTLWEKLKEKITSYVN